MKRGPTCDGGREELFLAGTAPEHECTWHRVARVDPQNGLLVPSECHLADAVSRRVTVYESPFDAWAERTHSGLTERTTPRCPRPPPRNGANAKVSLLSPAPEETLQLDPDAPRAQQALALHAAVHGSSSPVTFFIDGKPFATTDAPHEAYWPIQPGRHAFRARLDQTGTQSDEHVVVVR